MDELKQLILQLGEQLNERIDGLETRFDRLELKVDNLEVRLNGLETKMDDGFKEVRQAITEIDKEHMQHVKVLKDYVYETALLKTKLHN